MAKASKSNARASAPESTEKAPSAASAPRSAATSTDDPFAGMNAFAGPLARKLHENGPFSVDEAFACANAFVETVNAMMSRGV